MDALAYDATAFMPFPRRTLYAGPETMAETIVKGRQRILKRERREVGVVNLEWSLLRQVIDPLRA
jgi:hypothetical protein